MTTEVLTSGTSWTVPAGVTSVNVECWGAGAGSHTQSSIFVGVGGGAYAATTGVSVTPGAVITISIGAAGVADTAGSPGSGTDGGDTCFGGTALVSCTVGAQGGKSATRAGGAAASCVGVTAFSGGAGFNGAGGGGGAAGPDGAGGAGLVNRSGGAGDNGLGGAGGTGGASIPGTAGA